LKSTLVTILLLIAFGSGAIKAQEKAARKPVKSAKATVWLTKPDRSALLEKQATPLIFSILKNNYPTITVDENQKYQQIDGFGFTLTGGSAVLINKLPLQTRKHLLNELFSTKGNGIGVSYLRISIGASDLNSEVFYL
jgi:glucosylceramidase